MSRYAQYSAGLRQRRECKDGLGVVCSTTAAQTTPRVCRLNAVSSSIVSLVGVGCIDAAAAGACFPRPRQLYQPYNAPATRRDSACAGAGALTK